MTTMAYFVHQILFLGTFLCITVSANLMMEYNWPEPDRNINLFPHESSCHYYYLMLSEEDITVEKCPDGQMFDYTKHRCISDKEHVHCWSRHFGKLKHDHLHVKHKKHFKCPYPWGKYPNLHDCSKYHLCLNGKSRVKKCAPFELFDKISRKCIASIDAVCADKSDVVEHGYVCPKTWGSFTYSKDCSKYYECLQKKPSLRTCQKGRLFDDRLRKCAPQEQVYCGLRHNPYEKVSSDIPETTSIPTTTIDPTIDPTTLSNDVTIITTKITSVKPTSQEPSSSFKEVTSTPPETSSIFKEVTSTRQENSSTFKEVTSSIPRETSSTIKKVTTISQESSSIFKDTSIPHETSSILNEASSTNTPINTETSNSSTLLKQESSIPIADPNDIEKVEKQRNASDVTVEFPRKKENFEVFATRIEKQQIEVATQASSGDDSEQLKKDVSTEEQDTDDISAPGTALEADIHSSGCLQEDSMCVTEKDGTIVKCSSSKNLQPHPKDEKRFLDCSGSKIKIYACPPPLTFHPDMQRCKR